MHTEITIVEAHPRPLAAVRVTTVLSRWPRQFKTALDKVYEAARAGKVRQNGHNVMVYRLRPDGRVDIECGIECGIEITAESVAVRAVIYGDVVYCETPPGRAVTAAHIGPYQELGATHNAIQEWCRANGHRLTGVCWEIYGDWEEVHAKLRTELFHLLG